MEIGFVFSRSKPCNKKKRYTEEQERKWDEMFGKLCDFKKQHGHCVVSKNDEEHHALALWVQAQRCAFGRGIASSFSATQNLDVPKLLLHSISASHETMVLPPLVHECFRRRVVMLDDAR